MNSVVTSLGLLIARVGFGCLMLVHGYPKFQTLMAAVKSGDYQFADPLQIGAKWSLFGAVGAEFGCSLLLIVGLLTRMAAIPLAFTMAVAAFMIHSEDDWGTKEKAVLYLVVYVALIFTGPGQFSLDYLLFGKKKSDLPVK